MRSYFPALRPIGLSRPLRIVSAVAVVAALTGIGAGQAAARPLHALPAQVHRTGGSRVTAHKPASGDLAVYGSGDVNGYHLYVASAKHGWKWRALATIQPLGDDEQRWIGQQCLTGDGRTVVAVVAPWSVNNSELGMDSGALAYAVNARTGAVKPIAAGVSLAYFNPGCDANGTVALTSYLGTSQRPTRVSVFDAASGRLVRTATVRAEVTSAVESRGQIYAAEGSDLINMTAGSPRIVHRFGGQLAYLRPSAGGGIDLTARGRGDLVQVWHYSAARGARMLGSGPEQEMRLFGGAGGHNIVANAGRLVARSGLTAVRLPGGTAPASVSSDGGFFQVTDIRAPMSATRADDADVASWQPGAEYVTRGALPKATASAVLAVPKFSAVGTNATGPGSRLPGAASSAASPDESVPQCAVPRNDIWKQVWQPGADQVRWAINQAALGALTSPRPTSPQDYRADDSVTTALPTLDPSTKWPLVNLSGDETVPPLVMYGILAQESNWDQASFHAVPGRSGNPLVADYYGVNNLLNPAYPNFPEDLDYNYADCGYGIAQVTDGMKNAGYPSSNKPPTATQLTLAVDYASNIADAESILQAKWGQLAQLGIMMNDGDPDQVENWYGAIWAYNSGVHMNTANDPGLGLGWFNNPANPLYPYNRHTFLHEGTIATPTDSATPEDWPYQEKVFGWMEVPLEFNGVLDYRGTYDWDTGIGSFLNTPGPEFFCSETVNSCNPNDIGQSDPCPNENQSCYWDQPVQWVPDDCVSSCITDTVTNAPNGHEYYDTPGLAEPHDSPQSATCSLGANTPITNSSGNLVTGAVLVDSEMIKSENPGYLAPNLMNCQVSSSILNTATAAGATFSLLAPDGNPIDAAANPGESSAVDLHQLGGGFGGQMFFTHTGAAPEARGQWQATLPVNDTSTGTVYQIYAFVPDIAAATSHATYEINTGEPSTDVVPPGIEYPQLTGADTNLDFARTIDQAQYTNQWVSLGYYLCGGPTGGTTSNPSSCRMTVTLRSAEASMSPTGDDIAFNAVAFVPAPIGGYVALGDSYSSGEGAGDFQDGTDYAQNAGESGDNGDLCHRSSLAWPALLAAAKNWSFVNLACSGSNLSDLLGQANGGSYTLDETFNAGFFSFNGQSFILPETKINGPGGLGSGSVFDHPNPDNAGSAYNSEPNSQLDLMRALRPKVVTVSIGGNDSGFAEVIETCLLLGVNSCSSWFSYNGKDQIDTRIASLKQYLVDAYTDIKNAAGTSNVYAVTYPSPMTYDPGLPASAPDCTGLTNGTRQWLTGKVPELASTIMSAAGQAGIHYIDLSTLFNGHDACASVPYAQGLPGSVAATVICAAAGPSCYDNWFHPNQAGYAAMEKAVASKISF